MVFLCPHNIITLCTYVYLSHVAAELGIVIPVKGAVIIRDIQDST